MSYPELSDKFELVSSHLRKGLQVSANLCSFYKNFKKALDTFSQQTLKSIDAFSAELPKDINSATLSRLLTSTTIHFRKFAAQQAMYSRHLQQEIIDPLELFISQINNSNTNLVNKVTPTHKQLQKAIQKMEKHKEKHIKCSSEAEKIEKQYNYNDTSEKQQKMYKQVLQYKNSAFKASEAYDKSVFDANQCWNDYDSIIPGIMADFQQNEESRIHFIKYSIEKYANYYIAYQKNINEIFEELNVALGTVNSEIDIKEFVDNHKSSSPIKREEFVSYEKWKRLQKKGNQPVFNEEDYEILGDAGIQNGKDPDLELVKAVLGYLIPFKLDPVRDSIFINSPEEDKSSEEVLDSRFYAKLSELLHTAEGRELFCDVLEHKNSNRCLEYSKITQLASLIKGMLTAMMIDGDTDSSIFCKVIFVSDKFYTENEANKKQYLASFISSHCIWSDAKRWNQAILSAIETQLENESESPLSPNKRRKIRNGLVTAIKSWTHKIPLIFQKRLADERAEKAAAYLMISQFNYHMIKLGIPVETANSIVLAACQSVNLDPERTCLLLAEVLNTKRLLVHLESPVEVSLKAREKERERFGALLPYGLAIDFLQPNECFSLVLVCKQWKNIFYHQIIKKWLTEWNLSAEKKHYLRSQAWVTLLKANIRRIEYSTYLNKISELGDIEEVIDLDVIRSYQGHQIITGQILKNILKSIAVYNPEIGYCQGMNYVAGTLYVQLQDEELVFKCLIGMIEKFQMQPLYVQSLPKLKQFFYQLDRLIGILLPDIHSLFREIGLCSGHFTASWFITVFSSILQDKPELLLSIWDLFFLEGWKIAFKVCIAILSRASREIQGKRFEDVMSLLTNINTPNCPIDVFDERFLEKVHKIDISNALLRDLESEYEHLKIRAYNKHAKY
ncbi:unnamed protein product [Blepharisma stoltei]|uniref:Rab-GAP TBC domain-containing protein n=1 Tax=Blepharisma stoltei TaxID=1481888 RepID=A0AAU9JAU8_9CILI|nr:unnamed protein product [Blepharisma stoltei]